MRFKFKQGYLNLFLTNTLENGINPFILSLSMGEIVQTVAFSLHRGNKENWIKKMTPKKVYAPWGSSCPRFIHCCCIVVIQGLGNRLLIFFYILCPFRTWAVIALHNFLLFIAITNIYPLTIHPCSCSTIHFCKLIRYITPLAFSMLSECQIFQAFFPHCVIQKFQRSTYNG